MRTEARLLAVFLVHACAAALNTGEARAQEARPAGAAGPAGAAAPAARVLTLAQIAG